MNPKQEYEAMPLEARLNYAERAIALMIGAIQRAAEDAAAAGIKLRKSAASSFKAGRISGALADDAQAIGAERAARELTATLRRLRGWQGGTDSVHELPFPI